MAVFAGEPATAAQINTILAGTLEKPLCRLVQQANQSLTDNTDTALTFGAASEEIDTHGFHDTATNTNRITPTKAGYYTLRAILVVPAGGDYASVQMYIRKNGTLNIPSVIREGPNATSSSRSLEVTVLNSANGSTDYFEVMAIQDNTANTARSTPSNGGSFSCVFECVFERPL